MKIGVIGTGAIGAAVVIRLAKAGIPVAIWNRTKSRSADLTQESVTTAASVSALVEQCDVLVSCLSDDGATLAVSRQINDCAPGKPRIHVSTTTNSPGTIVWLAKQSEVAGVQFLCAPVLGRPEMIRSGIARVLVSGDETTYRRAAPVLETIFGHVDFLGTAHDKAAKYKLALNLLAGCLISSLGEALVYVDRQGEACQSFLEYLESSPLASPMLKSFSAAILEPDDPDQASFRISLAGKDLGYFLDGVGRGNREFPISHAVFEQLDKAIADGRGDSDWTKMAARLFA